MNSTPAIAYLRVSGKSQIDGDGFPRQQEAIRRSAKNHGLNIEREFREEGFTGDAQWDQRPAFMEMVTFLLDEHSGGTIFVENLTRLARSYSIQEAILVFLASKGINLISSDTGENITEALKGDPMKVAMIQMQAVFSQLEKNSLVRKLRAARERKKAETGRCEGQRPFGSLPGEEETLRRMTELKERGIPMRLIADHLNACGEVTRTRNGRPWHFSSVAKILARHEEGIFRPLDAATCSLPKLE